MVRLPVLDNISLDAVDNLLEQEQEQRHRYHLGASEIGAPCSRALWYRFRWFKKSWFPAKILRVFRMGHFIEAEIIKDLRKKFQVWNKKDDDTQYGFESLNGHFAGSCDGIIKGLEEAPKTPHVLEIKSAKDSKFKEMVRKPLEEVQPKYYAQTQLYPIKLHLKDTLLVIENKDTSERHSIRIKATAAKAKEYEAKAREIIESPYPLEKIGGPDWYQCKYCDFYNICQYNRTDEIERNCRTCVHSKTNTKEGLPQWTCSLHNKEINKEEQLKGCSQHEAISEL